jgi:hypothetical protein
LCSFCRHSGHNKRTCSERKHYEAGLRDGDAINAWFDRLEAADRGRREAQAALAARLLEEAATRRRETLNAWALAGLAPGAREARLAREAAKDEERFLRRIYTRAADDAAFIADAMADGELMASARRRLEAIHAE